MGECEKCGVEFTTDELIGGIEKPTAPASIHCDGLFDFVLCYNCTMKCMIEGETVTVKRGTLSMEFKINTDSK